MPSALIPSTVERVPQRTADWVNERIRRRTQVRVHDYAHHDPRLLGMRLKELDREWDIERVLEVNAAIASLLGLVLSRVVDRRWSLLTAVVGGFLLEHAIQGWCPPVPLFRRLGVRTQREIDEERYAIKALRGDVRLVDQAKPTAGDDALRAAEQ
jgi:hypothetical protein